MAAAGGNSEQGSALQNAPACRTMPGGERHSCASGAGATPPAIADCRPARRLSFFLSECIRCRRAARLRPVRQLMSSRSLRIFAVTAGAAFSLLLHQGVAAQSTVPTISSVAIVSSPEDSVSYQAGETIQFSVQFTSTVSVSGSPTLTFYLGADTRHALFESVRGSEVLFAYTVRSPGADVDHDGVSILADAPSLGSGDAITDSQGRDADLGHAAQPADLAHRVNLSTVTIEAAGTDPVPEDERARYILRRTGDIAHGLRVNLTYVLDDDLSDPDPDVLSGASAYVFDHQVPRTVRFQPGRSSVPLEVPLYNDAEIEGVDGSLTMVVAEGDDYAVGQPASATRILTDNNDVRVAVGVAVSLGTKIESGERLDTQINLKTTSDRDEPPDQFWLSASTRQGTALQQPFRGQGGDFIRASQLLSVESFDWSSGPALDSSSNPFTQWTTGIAFPITIVNDNVPEPTEYLELWIQKAPSTPEGVLEAERLPHRSRVTITDDDDAWHVEVHRVDGDTTMAVSEGQTIDTLEDGSQSGDLVLDLIATRRYDGNPSNDTVVIDMELVGDTEAGLDATYLTDFRRRDDSPSVAALQPVVLRHDRTALAEGEHAQAKQRVRIRTIDDSDVEGDEDFRVKLAKKSPDHHITFEASRFDVRILDNEAPPVAVTADADSIEEGEDVTFTLTRPAGDSTESLAVTLGIVESAEYIDYSDGFVLPTALTFAAGESTVSVTVPTQDDRVPDGDGAIVATLQPGDGYSYTAEGRSASVAVLEGLPDLTLTSVTVREDRSGSVAVDLSQASDETVSFNWTTADGQGDRAATGGASAGIGIDYRSGSGTVEIAAGETSAIIPVRTFDDAIDEHTETLHVVLSNIVGAAAADPRATVSIRDTDDLPGLKVENGTCPNPGNPSDTTCTEGDDGYMDFDVWLRVDRNQGASGKEVSVDWVARDYAASVNTGDAGKARAGSDYVAGSGTLTFPPGVGRLTVQVELLDDEIGENTERFSFILEDLVNAEQYDSFAYGEILDDGDLDDDGVDPDAPTLSAAAASVAEGSGTARVRVQMSRATDDDVSFDWATADNAPTASAEADKDYTSADGTATIAAGQLSTLIDIPITQDLIYETDETFTVTLSNPVDASLGSDPSATVTILDDDRRPSLSVRDASADEESGPLRFAVERTGASAVAVSANWATADGTAASPADFTAADGTVTIAPGETTATISVTLAPDSVDESDEDLQVTLSSPAESTLLRGTATGTILDNDEQGGGDMPRLVVAPTAVSVGEGDSAGASYTVKLASEPSADVTVSVSGASDSDVSVSPSSLSFTTGNWAAAQAVTVTAGHDDDHADDAVTLSNTAAGGDYGGAKPVAVAVTVADDDRAALVVSPAGVTVDEGDTAGADAGAAYTVKLATQPSGNVAVTITGTAGTEVSLDTSSLTFTAGDWDTAQTVRATAGHDDDADDDTVTLTHAGAGGGYSSARDTVTVTVADDDTARTAGLLLVPTSLEIHEGGGTTYQVRLATEPSANVTVTITGADADLTVLSVRPAVLTFTPADWDTPRTVALGAGADADTVDDQMTLTHTAASGDTAYEGLSATLAVKVIDDGSTGHAGVEVNPNQLSVDEGGGTGYNVRLRSQPSGDVTVTVTGAADSNLEGVPGTLAFTDVDWGVWQSVAMTAGHDGDIDDDAATLTHTAAGGSYGGQSAVVTVTIVDDDAAGVSLAPTRVSVTEGGGGTTYTAVLDSQPSADVTVTVGGAGSEVSLDKSSLTFAAGNWDTPQTVTVTAVDDTIDEDIETVTLSHTTASSDDDYDGLARTLGVTVRDNDSAAVVAPAAVTVTEGGAGVAYQVKLATQPSADVTVTIGGVPHDDITLDRTTLTFTSGNWDTPQTVTVTAVDDEEDEEDTETVTLPHRTASDDAKYGDVAVVAVTTVTVRDNDYPPVEVSYGASSYSVNEGASVTVTVELSAAPEREVEVPLTHTAQGDTTAADYSGVPTSVTFASSDTEKTFTFTAADDTVDDDGESVVLGFGTLPDEVSAGATDQATVSITDDDTAPASITLTTLPASVSESASGTTVTVTATLDGSVTLPGATEVTVSVGGGTATSGTDYAAVSDFTVTIPKETASGTGTFTLTPTQDSIAEGDESIDVTGSATDFTVTKAEVTLTDDDTAPAAITLTASPGSVLESASGTTVTVTATLGGSATLPGATEVSVSVGGGTATSGTDYAAVSDFTVTIPKETASGTGTFTLTPTQDTIAEGDETIDVTGTADGFTVTKAEITLTDDETAPASITLTTSPTSVLESASGTTVTVTATLDGSATLPGATEVSVSVGGGSATSGTDYTAVSDFTVTIPKETASGTGTFTLTPTQDDIAEGDESIDVTGTADGFTVTKAEVTLTDDDTASGSITLTVSPTSVGEDDGATTVTVTATLGGSATLLTATEVTVSVGGGTATSGTDYTAVSNFTVTIPRETASGTGTFTLTPTQDDIAEGDESIDVTGTADGFTVTKAEVTLTDDETAPAAITLTTSPTSVGEDGGATTVTVTATLDGSATLLTATTVTVSVGGGTATSGTDYAAVSDFAVTIPKESRSGNGTFTLTPTNDSLAEGDESIDVTGTAADFTVTKAQVTLTDDETAPAAITLTVSPTSVEEDDGATTVTVTATLGGSATLPDATEVTVSVGGGTATSGTDYAAVSDFAVTIPKESASGTGTFTLTPTNDSLAEGEETIDVDGAAEGFTVTQAQVTLTDDAPPVEVSFAQASYTVAEGGTVTVTVELSAVPEREVEVALTHTAQGVTTAADYSGVPTSVTFAPSETEQTFTFAAAADDVDDDGDSVLLEFGTPLPDGVSEGATATSTVSITDDDVPPVQVFFEPAAYTVAEDSAIAVTVRLDVAPERLVSVPITVANQGDTTAADYSGAPTIVVFAGDETEQSFPFGARDDTVDDDGESVVLGFGELPARVSAPDTTARPASATVSITDDDTALASITLTTLPVSVSESASGTTVTVTATLDGSVTLSTATEVTVSVGGGTATSGTDYAAVSSFTVTIPKETASGTGTFTLTPTNDSLAEGEETIDVTGSATDFTVTKAQVTLTDDDTAPTAITLTTTPTSVSESASGTTVTVTATLGGSATLLTATEVAVSVGGGTATSGTDYAAVSDFAVTIPAETASGTGTFTLTPTNDSLAEGDESIDVTGSATDFTVTKAEVTLTDDETAPAAITLTVSPTSVSESASGTTVTVTATLGGSATLLTATEVAVSVGGGTATSGTDYAAVSDFTVTIPKESARGMATFTLTPTNDAIAEGDETIDVTGMATDFTVTKAEVTLTDDETAPASITLTTSPTSVGEDDAATTVTVTATLGGSATRPGATDVVVSVGGGSATSGTDYTAVSNFTVTIPKETASGSGTFTLTPTQDTIAEGDETIDVTGAADGFTVTKDEMTLTDDETAPASITLTTSPTSVGEDDGVTTVTVTATLDGSVTLSTATEVTVSVGGGTATSGTDYTAVSNFTVTIPKETASGSGTFTLTPTQDDIAEGDETIDVTGEATGFTVTKAEITLTDDDTASGSITLTVSPTSVGEDDDATTVTVTATLGGSVTLLTATTVTVSVGGGSATSGTDYTAVSDFTVTIPRETASGSGTFTLTPMQDSIAEGDESIDVTGMATGFTVTKAQVTLTDDDTAPASITLTVSPASVSEDDGVTTVTVTATLGGSVTLSTATEVTVSVGGGSATSGTDYTAVSDFTVTIPKETASETGTFTLTPAQDDIAEGDETIDVTGTADGFTVTKAEMTLTDDETAPGSITLSVSPTSVEEDDGATTVTVTATLGGSATLPGATEVSVSVGGGTATSGTDYAAVSDFTVTIPKESTSGAGTFTLTPTNDAIAEGDETIDVTGSATDFTVTKAQVTLTDDETAPGSITLAVSPTSVEEDDGATTVTVTATLDGSATRLSATEVVVSVGGGTATSGTDYAAVSDFTVTIPKESARGTATFTLTPTQDAIAEGDESIDVTGSATDFTVTQAQVTLTDDETAPASITLTTSPTSVSEPGSGTTVTVTATLGGSATLPGATEVTVSVGGGTATSGTDYAAVPDFTVTIPKESARGTGTFTLTPTQDSLAEGDETIDVTGSATDFTVTKAEVTLTDDETAPASITLSASPASLSEDDGATTITVTATLGGSATLPGATEVTVSVGGGTATSGTDYAAVPDFTVTIPKESASGTGTFTLTPTNDSLAEGDESIDVTGTATGFTVTKAQVTLTDDETAPGSITLSVSPTSVEEDDGATTVTVTATLDGSVTLPGATEVTVSVGGGTATSGTDYTAVSDFTVTIPKESASGTGTFTLTATNDSLAEGDETIDVTGSATDFTVTKAEMTLTDDETAPASITLTTSPTSVSEDDGATTVTVTATLGGSATLLTATTVTVSVGGGTATSGTDYAAVSDFAVTIPKESASGTGTFNLTPTNDSLAEGDETIDVTGSATDFTVTKAEVTLTDDETAPASITLTTSPTSVSEPGSGTTVTVTATLGGSATLPGATEVTVSVGGGTATSGTDYAAVPDFTVTIPKESARGTGTFTLTPTQDSLAEGDETIDVTGSATDFTVTQAQVTLTDDETAPGSITLSVSPTSVEEDDGATTITVTATLGGSATLPGATEVSVSVGGGTATSGTDYAAVPDFTVTIPKESARGTGTFTLTPTNDSLAEGDESIDVTGSATDFTVTKAEVTLTDDETAPASITLTTSPTSVSESGSGTTVTVTATLGGSATLLTATEVTVSVGGGTATSGTDYAAVPDFTVTIPKESARGTGTFTLTPTNDSLAEGDETIDVTGSATDFTVTKAEVTLTDADVPQRTVSFDKQLFPVTEGATRQVLMQVDLSGPLDREVTIPLTTTHGSGVEASDYDLAAISAEDYYAEADPENSTWTSLDGDLIFAPAETGKIIKVTAVDDSIVEDDEILELGFGTLPEGISPGSIRVARVTITDNDDGDDGDNDDNDDNDNDDGDDGDDDSDDVDDSDDNDAPYIRGICDRTPRVRDRILVRLKYQHGFKDGCAEVTETDLAKLTLLDLRRNPSTESAFSLSLQRHDFEGLLNVVELDLADTGLGSLPAGVFDGLTNLETLNLNKNRLGSLPAGVFADLRSLETLRLQQNPSLRSLSYDELEALPALTLLRVDRVGRRKLQVAGGEGDAALEVAAGGTVTYRVRLLAAPDFRVTAANPVRIGVISDTAGVAATPATLPFTKENWFRRQTVTVRAGASASGETATLAHEPSGTTTNSQGQPQSNYDFEAYPLPKVTVRVLSARISTTVAGRVGMAVADARVEEGAGAVLAFAVTLSRAASGTVTVDYATADGSARAGVDYTGARGTLTFRAGESSKTIEVAALDDAHDEGEETFTLRLSNVSGARVTDGEATGTIENSDPLPRALLARFGRTAAVHVVEQVEERLEASREPGFRGRVAGRELRRGMERDIALDLMRWLGRAAGVGRGGAGVGASGPMGGASGAAGPMGMAPSMGGAAGSLGMAPSTGGAAGSLGMAPDGRDGWLNGRGLLEMGLGGGDVLTGSAFALNREIRRGGVVSLWSRGARSRFSGREGALSLGGEVRTTMFGADYARGPLVVGLSLSNTRGLGEYAGPGAGRMLSSVTGLYPWLGYRATDRITVWGVTGYGVGGMLLTPGGGPALESGLSTAMAAAGTRGELVGGGGNGFELAFKADALWAGTAIDGVDGPEGRLVATAAAVTRVRTALEGSRGYNFGHGLSLKPSVEVGLRHDGGDAEAGAGIDVGGGLVASHPSSGLAVDVRVRTLLVHEAEGFREHGVSLSLSWNPTPSTPLGLTARLAPSWGGQATGAAEALWGRETMAGMGAPGGLASGNRLDAELAYGLAVGSRFVGTPRVGLRTSETGRDYRLGYGLGVLNGGGLRFELGVDAQRRESPLAGGADHAGLGRVAVQW